MRFDDPTTKNSQNCDFDSLSTMLADVHESGWQAESFFRGSRQSRIYVSDSDSAWVANLDQPKLAIGYELPVTVYENDTLLVRTTTEMTQSNGAGQFAIWENGEICFSD